MNELLSFLSSLGINLNISEASHPFVLFAFSILILCVVCLLCVLTISGFLLGLYVTTNEKLVAKVSKYPLLLKVFNFYKKTRVFYLIIEILILIYCLGLIFWLCWRVIYGIATA